jgi:hypothetical protein
MRLACLHCSSSFSSQHRARVRDRAGGPQETQNRPTGIGPESIGETSQAMAVGAWLFDGSHTCPAPSLATTLRYLQRWSASHWPPLAYSEGQVHHDCHACTYRPDARARRIAVASVNVLQGRIQAGWVGDYRPSCQPMPRPTSATRNRRSLDDPLGAQQEDRILPPLKQINYQGGFTRFVLRRGQRDDKVG